jgi:hypothetical protein
MRFPAGIRHVGFGYDVDPGRREVLEDAHAQFGGQAEEAETGM